MTTKPPVPARARAQRTGGPAWGWVWAERVAWTTGIAATMFWVVSMTSSAVSTRVELRRFAAAQSAGPTVAESPDQSLWSPKRIRAWTDTLTRKAPPPLAVLRIPHLRLEVPVLEGTDDWTLDRAVGHIEDTARPGSAGNSGIAGHRDGFFRGLKDVRVGDHLELETHAGLDEYRIERIWIVGPEDVSVLDPTPEPAITLVTCYPFYFIGPAPQRFIVRAVHTERRSSTIGN